MHPTCHSVATALAAAVPKQPEHIAWRDCYEAPVFSETASCLVIKTCASQAACSAALQWHTMPSTPRGSAAVTAKCAVPPPVTRARGKNKGCQSILPPKVLGAAAAGACRYHFVSGTAYSPVSGTPGHAEGTLHKQQGQVHATAFAQHNKRKRSALSTGILASSSRTINGLPRLQLLHKQQQQQQCATTVASEKLLT